jgi:hypothetical protein
LIPDIGKPQICACFIAHVERLFDHLRTGAFHLAAILGAIQWRGGRNHTCEKQKKENRQPHQLTSINHSLDPL